MLHPAQSQMRRRLHLRTDEKYWHPPRLNEWVPYGEGSISMSRRLRRNISRNFSDVCVTQVEPDQLEDAKHYHSCVVGRGTVSWCHSPEQITTRDVAGLNPLSNCTKSTKMCLLWCKRIKHERFDFYDAWNQHIWLQRKIKQGLPPNWWVLRKERVSMIFVGRISRCSIRILRTSSLRSMQVNAIV